MNNILILTTPFHLRQVIALKAQLQFQLSINYFLFSRFVSDEQIQAAFGDCNIRLHRFETEELQLTHEPPLKRIYNVVRNPLRQLRHYRSMVHANRKFINNVLMDVDTSKPTKLIICNDRDFLSQTAIWLVKKRVTSFSVTAVDEGTGFYIKETFKDEALKFLYNIISKPILGFKYRFIEQYGTHPEISEVFVRYPALLPSRKSSIRYSKIMAHDSTKRFRIKMMKPSILVFGTVLSEEGFCSAEEESSFYSALGTYLAAKGYGLAIKHHPRENIEKQKTIEAMLHNISKLEFQIIPSPVHGEEIDCSNQYRIINFGSSVMLSILETGYPATQVITLRLRNAAFPIHIFRKTHIVAFDRFVQNLSFLL